MKLNNFAKPLIYVSKTKKFSYIRRKIVILRAFLSRAYAWIHIPGMILMMTGVMYPYIRPYTDVNMFLLALLVLVGLFLIGFVERYLGFYIEDVNYNTENNSLLLERLQDLETKLDNIVEVINGDRETQKDWCQEQG
jgi:hypothetical protein